MSQLGHTDRKLALRIYAGTMRRDVDEVEKLRALASHASLKFHAIPHYAACSAGSRRFGHALK
jgi:hypothetical protein